MSSPDSTGSPSSTASSLNTTWVAAAVLIEAGCVLLSQRKAETSNPGAWEFPGGKIEPGEAPRKALVRELKEELGLRVTVGEVIEVLFEGGPRPLALLFFRVERQPDADGTVDAPRALDVADWRWWDAAAIGELDQLPMTPVDRTMLQRLVAAGEL